MILQVFINQNMFTFIVIDLSLANDVFARLQN
jgi:hypothetical protein